MKKTNEIIKGIESVNYSDYRIYNFVTEVLETEIEDSKFRNLLEELVDTYKCIMKEFFRKDNHGFFIQEVYDGTQETYFYTKKKYFSPSNLKKVMVEDDKYPYRYDSCYTKYINGEEEISIILDGWGDYSIERCGDQYTKTSFDHFWKKLSDLYNKIYYYEFEEDNA